MRRALRLFSFFVVCYCVAGIGEANAEVIVSYDFDGVSNPDLAADTVHPDLAATSVSKGPGGTFGSEGSYATQVLRLNPSDSTDNTLADAINDGDYASFSVTIPSTQTVDLTSFTYNAARGGGSTPRTLFLLSSIDGFTAGDVIESNPVSTTRPNLSAYTVELDAAQFQGLTDDTVEFRLYHSTPSTGNSIETDNWVLNGEVSAVPEPAAWVLAAVGLPFIFMLTRRRQ